jgi:serine/threonine protein kinase
LRIEDFDLSSDDHYYIAEYCENGSLETIGGNTFRGDIEKVVSILVPITQALNQAHARGIFHRDIKPANILLRRDGTPVIGDFGICHMDGQERVTLTDEAMGSRNYIAPEMESGRRSSNSTAATDVYSLGKVLYWMLSGGHIFARENHRERSLVEILNDQRFEHVHMLLDRTLIENPANRISANDFWMELITLQSLVIGRFAPLKPSIGIQCRFCGIGSYQPLKSDTLSVMGTKLGVHVVTANTMICARCGHMEWFNGEQSKSWWNK